MFCPVCENEYDETYKQCPACGSQLVPNLSGGVDRIEEATPLSPPEEEPDEEDEGDLIPPSELPELVQVFAGTGFAPELIRSVLEGSDIPVLVKRSGAEAAYGSAIDALIFVRESDAERAAEVIRAAEAGEYEILDDDQ